MIRQLIGFRIDLLAGYPGDKEIADRIADLTTAEIKEMRGNMSLIQYLAAQELIERDNETKEEVASGADPVVRGKWDNAVRELRDGSMADRDARVEAEVLHHRRSV